MPRWKTAQERLMREGEIKHLQKLGKLVGPFFIPMDPDLTTWKHYHHVSDKLRAIKILSYRVHLETVVDEEYHLVIGFDPADQGPHCDEFRRDGRSRKTYCDFDFNPMTGYKEALDSADREVELYWEMYAARYRAGEWPRERR
jgi:hypothetical protein